MQSEGYHGHDAALGNSGGFLSFEGTRPASAVNPSPITDRWELGWITQAAKAGFETYVKSLALAEIATVGQLCDSVEQEKHRSTYHNDCLAGKYAWKGNRKGEMGVHVWTRFNTDEGRRYMGFLLLRGRDKSMTFALADALIDSNPDGFAEVFAEVYRHPNSDTPEGKAAKTLPAQTNGSSTTSAPSLSAQRAAPVP